ncbi:MAG: UDP-glucose/GDP-mannose dehydrogenase family protein [Candidatus Yanofskybacteria bacterium]|nr:UDP-glucose/GDP-mannose dehydrogenase family protein [Candidatus Yanofskybacteria bacterium]
MSNKPQSRIKIGIIGLGMVGEPIKRWFEEYHKYRRGKELFCYDTDPKKGYSDDVNKADAVFIAVPTPANPNGSCNVSIVQNAVSTINDGKVVIIKSTVTPGTVEGLQKKYPHKKFIFNPEFLTESQSWLDYIKPDRQILGHTAKSYGDIKEILAVLPRAHFERPWSSDYSKKDINATEAELVKYASNVFGYIKVIYGNILADMCHALEVNFKKNKIGAEIDYENIREAISADPRIGPAWLNVGHGNYCGSGGFCFPKDMAAFIKFGEKLIDDLVKDKKTDDGHSKTLKKGIAVLQSIHDYNKALLAWQGLTIEDVSRHDREIVTQKVKPIRTHAKKRQN